MRERVVGSRKLLASHSADQAGGDRFTKTQRNDIRLGGNTDEGQTQRWTDKDSRSGWSRNRRLTTAD